MATTSIEWAQQVWNPVTGCTRASRGCDSCYAVTMTHRLEAMGKSKYTGLTVLNKNGDRHFNGVVRTHADMLVVPLKRKKPTVWFVNSMSDLFHKDVPLDFVDKVFAVMALCPQHTFQILTKRPERMAGYMDRTRRSITYLDDAARTLGYTLRFDTGNGHPLGLVSWPLPGVWLGTSVEDQARADERIPHLLECAANVRFLSVEPLLSQVDLTEWLAALDWIICGGESGANARPFDVLWAESIIDQCKAAGVPCFIKQLGSAPLLGDVGDPHGWPESGGPVNWETGHIKLKDKKGGDVSDWPAHLRVREFPKVAVPRNS